MARDRTRDLQFPEAATLPPETPGSVHNVLTSLWCAIDVNITRTNQHEKDMIMLILRRNEQDIAKLNSWVNVFTCNNKNMVIVTMNITLHIHVPGVIAKAVIFIFQIFNSNCSNDSICLFGKGHGKLKSFGSLLSLENHSTVVRLNWVTYFGQGWMIPASLEAES